MNIKYYKELYKWFRNFWSINNLDVAKAVFNNNFPPRSAS